MSHEDVSGEVPRPRLCDFILADRAEILAEWERVVRARSEIERGLSRPILIDEIPAVLDQLAAIIRRVEANQEASFEHTPELHALDRLERGFDLQVVVDEYALLRSTTLERYRARFGLDAVEEVWHFDFAVDQAIRASVTQYARARERTLAALDAISTAALGAPELRELLPRLLTVLMTCAEAVDAATVLLVDGQQLRVEAAVGLTAEHASELTLRIGEGFAGTIAERRAPLSVRDAAHDPRVLSQDIRSKKIRALYGVPLLAGGELVGVIDIGSMTEYAFNDEDQQLFRSTAARAAQFIAEARLRDERARAQNQVREEKERYEAVVNALDEFGQGLALMDGFRMTYVNHAFCEITRYPADELLALPDARVLLVRPRSPAMDEPLEASGSRHYETRVLRKDGEIRFVELSAKALGNNRRMVLVRDVTQAKRQAEDTQAAVAFRDQLIGILSHDLRTPLAAISASSQLLIRRGQQIQDPAALGRRINSVVHRMTNMLSGLLDFTQTRFRGLLPIAPVRADLREICAEVLDETRSAFPAAKIEGEFSGELTGTWDASRLAQVVANLVTNAVTHGTVGTPVRVRAEGTPAEVKLEVHNQGAPIAPDLLPRIFDAFTRGDRQTGPKGFGLGLFIANQVVRAHGGTIEVRSTADAGTSFLVTLPRTGAQKGSCGSIATH